jgi:predicted metal-dependent hydrolase
LTAGRHAQVLAANALKDVCDMGFDPRYIQFVRHWNQREFFECHEALEDLWFETHGPERKFYQGLIQGATAFLKLEKKNLRGARRLFAGALNCLEDYPPRYLGFRLREFVELLEIWQAKAVLASDECPVQFNPEELPALPFPVCQTAPKTT